MDGSSRTRRLFKRAVRKAVAGTVAKSDSVLDGEPLNDARTPLADFFKSLLEAEG